MTAVQEEGGDHAPLATKGKRTKRQRAASPLTATSAPSSSVSGNGGGGGGEFVEASEGAELGEIAKDNKEDNRETAVRSVSSTGDDDTGGCGMRGATKEEEDMANCLMLLRQGHKTGDQTGKAGFLNIKKPPSASSSSLGLGLEVAYQCKTCEKSFPSFQALGGHRASHKRPRNGSNYSEINIEEKKSPFAAEEKPESDDRIINSSFLSLQVTTSSSSSSYAHNSKKSEKTHGCSICKAEFSSGQALGGHMRRHRSALNSNANATAAKTLDYISNADSSSDHRSCQESKRPRNFLELDLNLPAPEDDRCDKPRFSFASKDQIVVFAAASSSLVDCHY